jgi:hypothetical protein
LGSQRRSIARVEFIIAKTKLLDRLRGQINERQQKALLRMFREGPEGFKCRLPLPSLAPSQLASSQPS